LSEDRFAADPSAALWSDAGPLPVPAEPDAVDAVCFVDKPSTNWAGPESRKLERFPVQGTRPIAMRPLHADGTPSGPWALADILDISLGGLCLLVTGPLALERGQPLELDLRSHPDFGVQRLQVEARWWMSSDSFSTLGIAFSTPLAAIPELALERRGVRRDPNLDSVASE
jgi:hypothetical protein